MRLVLQVGELSVGGGQGRGEVGGLTAGLSVRSVQIIHAVLRVMLAEAVRDELVERNVAAMCGLHRGHGRRSDRGVLTRRPRS